MADGLNGERVGRQRWWRSDSNDIDPTRSPTRHAATSSGVMGTHARCAGRGQAGTAPTARRCGPEGVGLAAEMASGLRDEWYRTGAR
jgi:hypothetical protein